MKEDDFRVDVDKFSNTIQVDNEHFYSDHLVHKNEMISSYTFKNVVDPNGTKKMRERRRSSDCFDEENPVCAANRLISEKTLYKDKVDGPFKVIKLDITKPYIAEHECKVRRSQDDEGFVFYDVNDQYEEQKREWGKITDLASETSDTPHKHAQSNSISTQAHHNSV